MLYVLCSDLLKSCLCAVIKQCCLWSHCFCVIQSYHCLITHSDRKNDDCTINRDNNDNVIIRVSTEEGDSREDLTEEEDEDREDEEEDEILSDNLKEAEREDESVFIDKKTHWDNSAGDKLIDKLYKYLLALFKHYSSWQWDEDFISLHWACIYIYTQSSSQDSEEDYVTINNMITVNSISKIMTEHCQSLKQALSITESRETVLCIK